MRQLCTDNTLNQAIPSGGFALPSFRIAGRGPGLQPAPAPRTSGYVQVVQVHPASSQPFAGVLPIAPTPFTDTGELDLDGQRRVLDCMVDQGVDGICILANYSEQFLLTDAERDTLVDVCISHVAARVPVIVTCSHFSTRIAAELGRKSPSAGSALLMLIPPFPGSG